MKQRCYNTKSQRWYTHGNRGITVYSVWKDSFDTFLNDMGWKPPGMTLDRIDNNDNYYKENCRWASPKEQAENRRSNVLVEYQGTTKTISQWASVLNITHSAMTKRLNNWPLDKAMDPSYFGNQFITETIKQKVMDLYYSNNISQVKLGKLYNISQAAISKWVVANKESLGNPPHN